MAAGTQPTDLSDFRTALINAVREATGVSATNTLADRYLNSALHDLHLNWDLPWSIRRATLVTQDDYSTGTVTVSQGSTAVTGASTVWNTNNAFGVANARNGGKIVLGSVSDGIYLVSGTPTATSITLGTRFTGSDLSASSYVYFEDEYALAGGLRGEPLELVRCETVDIEVPAHAEIVVEGRILAGAREDEGPFGEWTGYMSGRAPRPVAFHDAPRAGGRPGSILGGTGIAISHRASVGDDLRAHLLWLMSDETQRGFIPQHDGQPGLRAAWADPRVNADWGDFYTNTAATLEAAAIRPRHDGYIAFQTRASAFLRDAFEARHPAARTARALGEMFLASQPQRRFA